MTIDQIEFWKFVLSVVSTFVVVIGAVAGSLKYFQERRRDREARQEELAWRKTQFVFGLVDNFEKDERHQIVLKLLAYDHAMPKGSSLGRILANEITELSDTELELRYSVDNYLDFFDTLSHFVYVTDSLKVSDLEVFGWYIAQIGATKEIREYAKYAGFDDVLMLSSDLRKEFGKKYWFKVFRKHQVTTRNVSTKSKYKK